MHSRDVRVIVNTINSWVKQGVLSSQVNLYRIRQVLKHFNGVIPYSIARLGKRKPLAKKSVNAKKSLENKQLSSNSCFRRTLSAGSLSRLDAETKGRTMTTNFQIEDKANAPEVERIDALRDQVRDKLRNIVHRTKCLVQETGPDSDCRDVCDRLTFLGSMGNGFFWDDTYASKQLDEACRNPTFFKAVLNKIHGLVSLVLQNGLTRSETHCEARAVLQETTGEEKGNVEDGIFRVYWLENVVYEYRVPPSPKLLNDLNRQASLPRAYHETFRSLKQTIETNRLCADFGEFEETVQKRIRDYGDNATTNNFLLSKLQVLLTNFKASQKHSARKSFSNASSKPNSRVAAMIEEKARLRHLSSLVLTNATLIVIPSVHPTSSGVVGEKKR